MTEEKLKGWHYMPDVPLQVSPFFSWPLRPLEMIRWLWNAWFLASERLILVGVAFISFYWFQPSLEESKVLASSWIMEMYVRNLILFVIVAGSLHLYFYTCSKQGDHLKFAPQPLATKGRKFTFGNQVKDNMFWSLGSGVLIWTGYEVLIFWAMANGYTPVISWAEHPVWFVALFMLIPVWESFYFYWIHRLLHVPFLYKHVHALHHRNINVGPWSGLSMHPVEQLIFLGSVLIHWVVAAHPVHILYHMQYYVLTAITTHTGFEGIVVKNKNRLKLGAFHHQMHHRYFECNYGSLEIPWDKLFGSFHNGTIEADARMKDRRKRILGA